MQTTKLDGGLGVRVEGVDLAKDNDPGTLQVLINLLYEHHVLVIGGQSLSTQAYLRFGQHWGAPIEFLREDQRVEGCPEVIIVSNSPILFPEGQRDYAVHWHSDSTYEEAPASTTMLYCIEAPRVGGATLFADTEAAYEALSTDVKARVDGLVLTHMAGHGQRDEEFGERPHSKKPFSEDAKKRIKEFRHPLVMKHPVTGRNVLFGVAGTATGIVGMEQSEALKLITDLKRHTLQPAFRGEYSARPGDILIWDNYSLIHTATPIEYSLDDGMRRVLHRISVKGLPQTAMASVA